MCHDNKFEKGHECSECHFVSQTASSTVCRLLTTLRRETYMYIKNAFPFENGKRIFTSVCFAKRTAAVVLRCNCYDNVT